MKKTTLTLGSVTLAAALALTGCGSNDDKQNADSGSSDAPSMAGSEKKADDSSSGGADSSEPGITNLDAALTAIKTAEAKAGKATELDLSDDGKEWEVKTIDGGDKYEFDISADGKEIVKEKKKRADKEDQDEAKAAKVTLPEAIEKVGEKYGGELDDADLDDDKNVYQYEITLKNGSEETDYYVHAESGEVSESKHS